MRFSTTSPLVLRCICVVVEDVQRSTPATCQYTKTHVDVIGRQTGVYVSTLQCNALCRMFTFLTFTARLDAQRTVQICVNEESCTFP